MCKKNELFALNYSKRLVREVDFFFISSRHCTILFTTSKRFFPRISVKMNIKNIFVLCAVLFAIGVDEEKCLLLYFIYLLASFWVLTLHTVTHIDNILIERNTLLFIFFILGSQSTEMNDPNIYIITKYSLDPMCCVYLHLAWAKHAFWLEYGVTDNNEMLPSNFWLHLILLLLSVDMVGYKGGPYTYNNI